MPPGWTVTSAAAIVVEALKSRLGDLSHAALDLPGDRPARKRVVERGRPVQALDCFLVGRERARNPALKDPEIRSGERFSGRAEIGREDVRWRMRDPVGPTVC
jgi:hypothetical protein